jgi:D-serine deaminase-like pyridoxal phosphate-dependent protein
VLTSDQYFVKGYGHLLEYPDAVVPSLSEEHGVIDISKCKDKPSVGDIVHVVPNHCCVVSNMVDKVYGVRRGQVEVVWPVAARGTVQ